MIAITAMWKRHPIVDLALRQCPYAVVAGSEGVRSRKWIAEQGLPWPV